MEWERAVMRPGPRILSDHIPVELCPQIEKENMTWVRVAGKTPSEVAALDDYTFPFTVGGVNKYIFSTSVIRHMLNIKSPNTSPEENKEVVAAFLATQLDKIGNPVGGRETTLEKIIRFFQPYVVVTSKVDRSYAATIGYNGNEVTGLFAGSNLSQASFHPAATVQTELRMPIDQLFCLPGCNGRTCGIFAVFDTNYSSSARVTDERPYGLNRVRYVVAPTRDAEAVHSYERVQEMQGSIKSETELYTYEIAVRRIASIPSYSDLSLRKADPDTVGVSEYLVDFSPKWYYRRYMVCLEEKN